MAKKAKYYVVWVGKVPGVYPTWNQCESQIKNFAAAKYKSFETKAEAEVAYKRPWENYYAVSNKKGQPFVKGESEKPVLNLPPDFVHGIAVDASTRGNPGPSEYRGVDTLTGMEIFRSPLFPLGTNNIGEFLAIVHALALFHKSNPDIIIYSDSKLAMGWIKAKKCRSKLPQVKATANLYSVIARAESWLQNNKYKNKIMKWETKIWGENMADFGRK